MTHVHVMTGELSWRKGQPILQRHGTMERGTSGRSPAPDISCSVSEDTRVRASHVSELTCPRRVTLAAWHRYFRPNEAHMAQGLAPSGCSYLAGKLRAPESVHSAPSNILSGVACAWPGARPERLPVLQLRCHATGRTCVSRACPAPTGPICLLDGHAVRICINTGFQL